MRERADWIVKTTRWNEIKSRMIGSVHLDARGQEMTVACLIVGDNVRKKQKSVHE